MELKRKDLLGVKDCEPGEITFILDTADSFKEVATREIKKVPTLRGKTIVNLFFEPSTRTRTSFELAAKRLSADLVTITPAGSSLVKGETLLDMVRSLQAMKADVIILRHPASGAPHLLARQVSCSVINAGDGSHEHPTQALLDLFTIREKKGRIDGLRVAIVGDIAHSRVARSNIFALTRMGASVRVVGPPTMIPREVEEWGVSVSYRLEEGIADADVIIMLRLQIERQGRCFFPSLREYATLYGLTGEKLRLAKPGALVMHPGPINRGVELSPEVADGLSSMILEQVTNGIAVRMAVLYLWAGGS